MAKKSFTLEHLKEILYVKNNCLISEFLEHLKLLAQHFNFEVPEYDELIQKFIMLELEYPDTVFLKETTLDETGTKVLCVLLKRRKFSLTGT